MHLTSYSDYALRILIYLGTYVDKPLITIREISDTFRTSHHHISKIVYDLNKLGIVETVRGRKGGIRLAQSPKEINLGALIRVTEENFNLTECFNEPLDECKISSCCRLKLILKEALAAYMEVLDSYTLEDLLENAQTLRKLVNIVDRGLLTRISKASVEVQ